MYVWSDNDHLYRKARIIFTDTEKSNWTWDEVAKQYYWHRFFSHQPDLNFDNPQVLEEVLKAMRFWLDLGVDALRMDAIPYLVERDGTSCENLPETHAAIKKIRAAIDAEYSNRLILAEANQWPTDVRPYFGDGDECHMAFHFPLMPRIYMALRQEDRLPITEIMAQTPDIPESCQWGLFLRNHDELTLEMVTDDERDYMYLAYSADPRMRINVGIRRRLAPLVDNNRRRIELLNSLLLSFPGTPILYYGDEIGMGDNIYLGDRNGVRTPMQWSSDRNAGFSRAVPAKLYFPVIMDPIWGYQAINVEAQQSDPSSLLHWSRNMIALRKLFQVFGRGTLEFLEPENRKILAYIRRYNRERGRDSDGGGDEVVLCVANLSRFAQPVSLDLAEFEGMLPVEMLGYVPFPAITKAAYALTLAPYSFLWLELQPAPERVETPPVVEVANGATAGVHKLDLVGKAPGSEGNISSVLTGSGLNLLQELLPSYLQRQRWFGAKTRTITGVRVTDSAPFPRNLPAKGSAAPAAGAASAAEAAATNPASAGGAAPAIPPAPVEAAAARKKPPAETTTVSGPCGATMALVFLELTYDDSGVDSYQLPLAIATGEAAAAIRENAPNFVLATVNPVSGGTALPAAVLYDATASEDFRQHLLTLMETSGDLPTATGRLQAQRSAVFTEARGEGPLPARLGSAEQSNTSILYDGRLILKLFRRLQQGENPDTEIGRFLTEVARFPRVPPFLGDVRMVVQNGSEAGEPTTLAMLQGLVQNEGDGWQWTLDDISRYFDSCLTSPVPQDLGQFPGFGGSGDTGFVEVAREHAGLYLDAAALLGRRTAEMHLALVTPSEDPAFQPELFSARDLAVDAARIETQINRTLEALRHGMSNLPSSETDNTADTAALILSQRRSLLNRARRLSSVAPEAAGLRTRIHGDYHLGQVLRSKADFVILDFEGEPARPLQERRAKQSPLKDVAGMLRSFGYAAYVGLIAFMQRRPPNNPADARSLEAWATLWQNAVSTEFLGAYQAAIAQDTSLMPQPAEAQLLLNAYLLEKSLYELLYELNNRPTWVRIPLAGILALPQ
jgi:maltose alpha-D-glucosyltransferase / alpha-amylase